MASTDRRASKDRGTYAARWRSYTAFKQELQRRGLSSQEYTQALRRYCDAHKL
ncbi:MAG: hypothetical protein LBL25_02160 [Oscillospiraceae bacterium]|jgi:hypothetical protein|nr:hypothetical protein [Oscillospiraceae bacterium]